MSTESKDRRSDEGPSRVARVLPSVALALALSAALAALAISVIPSFGFATQSEALIVSIETTASLVAILAAFLVLGRYLLTRSLQDLALLGALVLLALTNVAFTLVPLLLDEPATPFTTWAPVAGRALAAVGFAAAALIPDVRVPSPRRGAVAMVLGSAALLGLVGAGIALLGDALPTAAEAGPSPAASDEADLDSAPGLLVLQLVMLLLYMAAAAGFVQRARRTRDELIGWFAVGTGLAAASRLHYFLFSAVDPDWVYSGDVVRLCFYLVLLIGALREIRHYQRRMALAAVLDERRRMARDLHDGLAQELAFIGSQVRQLESGSSGKAARVVSAADRALDESRDAIRALTRRSGDRFDQEVAQVAEQLTARAGVRLRLDLDSAAEVPPAARDQLIRILREAVTNGVRHGCASLVTVTLSRGAAARLTVSDDGVGFDHEAAKVDGGFGLTSMQERADLIGAKLAVSSRPDHGTVVEVTLGESE